MSSNALLVAAASLVGWAVGCHRDSNAEIQSSVAQTAPSAQHACGHAVCGNDYTIDVIAADGCTVGSTCRIFVQLAASGDYHVNDDYPHKFVADDTPGVEFLGTDAAGKNVFSKVAGDWTKSSRSTGSMLIRYKPADAQAKSVGGVLKFSVCSAQNCELERRQVNASVKATR